MNKLTQQQVWDKIAEKWNKFRRYELKEVSEFLQNKTGNILDLGCGSGRNFIKKSGLEIYGVDFSKEQLKYAEKYAKELGIGVNLKQSSADKIPFDDNFFDCAIFIASLHCIPTFTTRKNSLQELYRVLKPRSKAMITVWSKNQARVKNKPKESLIPWSHGIVDDKSKDKQFRYYYLYDNQEFQSLLESVGFKIISLKEDENIIAVVEK